MCPLIARIATKFLVSKHSTIPPSEWDLQSRMERTTSPHDSGPSPSMRDPAAETGLSSCGYWDIRSKGPHLQDRGRTVWDGRSARCWLLFSGARQGSRQEGSCNQLSWGFRALSDLSLHPGGGRPGETWQCSNKGGQSLSFTLERLMDPGTPWGLSLLGVHILVSSRIMISWVMRSSLMLGSMLNIESA